MKIAPRDQTLIHKTIVLTAMRRASGAAMGMALPGLPEGVVKGGVQEEGEQLEAQQEEEVAGVAGVAEEVEVEVKVHQVEGQLLPNRPC